MHLEEEQVQRTIHGELTALDREAVERHLAACSDCRGRIEEAENEERWVLDRIQEMESPTPSLDVDQLLARAATRPGRSRRGFARTARSARGGWSGRRLAWAAGIALLLGGFGLAYAVPGSPLRPWIDRAVQWVVAGGAKEKATTVRVADPQVPSSAGISVVPGERFTIRFVDPKSQGSVIVTRSAGAEVVVHARNGEAVFSAGDDRILIESEDPDVEYEIELPENAPLIEVLVGDRTVLRKEAGRISGEAALDRLGRYVVPLATPSR